MCLDQFRHFCVHLELKVPIVSEAGCSMLTIFSLALLLGWTWRSLFSAQEKGTVCIWLWYSVYSMWTISSLALLLTSTWRSLFLAQEKGTVCIWLWYCVYWMWTISSLALLLTSTWRSLFSAQEKGTVCICCEDDVNFCYTEYHLLFRRSSFLQNNAKW